MFPCVQKATHTAKDLKIAGFLVEGAQNWPCREKESAPSAGCPPSKSVLQFAAWRKERSTRKRDEQRGVACVSRKILAKARGRREYRGRQ